ncbi:MAG: hypothetical protein P8099_20565 [Gemmatimonadota bacterium]
MAVEFSNNAVKWTGVCGATSLATKQYNFVKLHTDGTVIICAAATDVPVGVLQNAPGIGEEAEVLIVGGTKIEIGGAINEGEVIGTDSAGLADTKVPGTDTTNYIVGQAITAGTAANQIITAVVNCAAPARAA